MSRSKRTYSTHTLKAIKVFGSLIKVARTKHRWTKEELAERAGTSRPTINRIEQGNPSTELGLYFEVAHLLGIPLFEADKENLSSIQKTLELQWAVLPSRVNKDTEEVFDDF